MTLTLLVDGVPTPMRSAQFEIGFPDPARPVQDLRSRGPRRVGPEDVIYSLTLDVDEHSGEDCAAAPMIQSIPVLGRLGRHPSLEELGTLDLSGAERPDADWDAWFGNDAPALYRNRLRFEGWTPAGLRLSWEAWNWEAPGEPGGALLHGDAAPEPGVLRFTGTARFEGLCASVADPAEADRFVRASWGETVFAALRRTTTPVPVPSAAKGVLPSFRVCYRPAFWPEAGWLG